MSEKFDAIVVGAGFGGSTCAALLAKRGLRTLLVDKNAVPGGKAMTVGDKGFRYDLWPIVGGPSLNSRFAEALDELERLIAHADATLAGMGGENLEEHRYWRGMALRGLGREAEALAEFRTALAFNPLYAPARAALAAGANGVMVEFRDTARKPGYYCFC